MFSFVADSSFSLQITDIEGARWKSIAFDLNNLYSGIYLHRGDAEDFSRADLYRATSFGQISIGQPPSGKSLSGGCEINKEKLVAFL